MPFSFLKNLFGGKREPEGESVNAYVTYHLRTLHEKATPVQLIERYRKQFRPNLVATWYAANGTFSTVMNERMIFYPDHTGRLDNIGPFGGLRSTMYFEWQEVADYTLRLHTTKWSDDEDDEPDDEPDEWIEVRYDFFVKSTDICEEVVLRQVIEGHNVEGFWDAQFDLGYSGPPETIEERLP